MKPVFIIGTGRSGSTIMARTLAEAPGVYKFKNTEPKLFCGLNGFNGLCTNLYRNTANEGLFFHWVNAWHRRVEKTAAGDDVATGLCEAVPADPFKAICRDYWRETAAHKGDWSVVVPAIRKAYRRFFELIDPNGACTHFIDDTPFNAMRARDIAAVFPDALVVHMIRDGRMVASSLLKLGWAATFQEGLYQWKARLDHARAVARALDLPKERYLEVSFSTLSTDTDAVFEDVFRVAGLSYDPAYKVGAKFRVEPEGKYENSEAETAYLKDLAGDIAEEFGWL
ncbi:MAG: sulfotransferase [Pseudomonadota bacterium]